MESNHHRGVAPMGQGSNLVAYHYALLSLEEDVRLELTHPFLSYCLFSKEIPYLIRVNLPKLAVEVGFEPTDPV